MSQPRPDAIAASWSILTEQGWFNVNGVEFKVRVEHRGTINDRTVWLWRLRIVDDPLDRQFEGSASKRLAARRACYKKARAVVAEDDRRHRQLAVENSIEKLDPDRVTDWTGVRTGS